MTESPISPQQVKTREEAVLASIMWQGVDTERGCWACGCSRGKSGRWFFCQYHDGYGDGWDARDEQGTA